MRAPLNHAVLRVSNESRRLRARVAELQAQLEEACRWIEGVQAVSATGWTEAMRLREQLREAEMEAMIERETSAWEERCRR